MPLQNRVTPRGEIVAHASRGQFTGNRGIIHDARTRTLLRRRWSSKAWITCALTYKGAQREVMSPGTWTELFFLDEVTALAAGHRPCFYCRRPHARAFADAAREGGELTTARAPSIDAILHSQRPAAGATPCVVEVDAVADLPDGVAIDAGGPLYMKRGSSLLPWGFHGYGAPVNLTALPDTGVQVLTPALIRAALGAGYEAQWHPSAQT